MKITFLLPHVHHLTGGLRVVAQHAAYLAERGHSVTLIGQDRDRTSRWRRFLRRAMGRPVPAREAGEEDHFSARGLDTIVFPADRPPTPQDLPDADIVIATWWQTAELLSDLPSEKGVAAHFVQDHEVFPSQPRDRVEAVYRQPTHKVVVASWLARVLQETYGQPSHLVMNGVETSVFHVPDRTRPHPPRIGFLHSTAIRKNIGLAVAAMEAARRARPDLRGIVFGSHHRPETLPGWIEYEQKPSQSRIPQIYAACDAWLFPSTSEGFGLPLLEAMACGTPVLAARAGAAEDLVTPENGRLLPREVEDFARAIVEIADMPDADWARLSQAARLTAEAHDLYPASERFEAVLSDIVATVGR